MDFDVCVIGGGPAGYAAALRASELGLRTAIVERDRIGGVCLNIGCIPTKAILESARVFRLAREGAAFGVATERVTVDYAAVIARSRRTAESVARGVAYLLKKASVELIEGEAVAAKTGCVVVRDRQGNEKPVSTRKIILATGSRPSSPPGIRPDGERIHTSDTALLSTTLPGSIIIVGAGAIGIEFSAIYADFGCAVTLVEMLEQVAPGADAELARELASALSRRGIRILTGAKIESVETGSGGVRCRVGDERIEASAMLVATGRAPNTDSLGLDKAGVRLDRGRVVVDGAFRTTAEGIYAAGDILPTPMLAHTAQHEGIAAAEAAAGRTPRPLRYENTPMAIYTEPQAAWAGKTEEALKREGIPYRACRTYVKGNGKAAALGEKHGFAKLLVSPEGKILGAHIVGPEATELLAEACLAMEAGLPARAIAETVHAHPTLSEMVAEAARTAAI